MLDSEDSETGKCVKFGSDQCNFFMIKKDIRYCLTSCIRDKILQYPHNGSAVECVSKCFEGTYNML